MITIKKKKQQTKTKNPLPPFLLYKGKKPHKSSKNVQSAYGNPVLETAQWVVTQLRTNTNELSQATPYVGNKHTSKHPLQIWDVVGSSVQGSTLSAVPHEAAMVFAARTIFSAEILHCTPNSGVFWGTVLGDS